MFEIIYSYLARSGHSPIFFHMVQFNSFFSCIAVVCAAVALAEEQGGYVGFPSSSLHSFGVGGLDYGFFHAPFFFDAHSVHGAHLSKVNTKNVKAKNHAAHAVKRKHHDDLYLKQFKELKRSRGDFAAKKASHGNKFNRHRKNAFNKDFKHLNAFKNFRGAGFGLY